jgi:peptide/nickel transport system permease protein
MIAYLLRRLALVALVLLGVVTIVFFAQRLSGDPVGLLLPVDATAQQRDELAHELGLDRPLPLQYARFVADMARGDLGFSYRQQRPALTLVLERLPSTLLLAGASLALATVLSIPLGILAAVRRDSWIDTAASFVSVIGQATPIYWLGLLLILLFSVQLRWLPSMGGDSFAALVLPVASLAVYSMARITRITRSAVLDTLSQDYVRTLRAKGLGEASLLFKHVLRNSSVPIVAMIGLQLGGLLGGAVLVESVFSWPGIGRLAVGAVQARDFPVVQAVTLIAAALFALVNLAIDLICAALNPQIRLE